MSRAGLLTDKTALTEKIREAAASVLPLAALVILLCFGFLPVETDVMLSFLVGAGFVIIGIGLFSLGADASMLPIGTKVGTALTKTRKLGTILPIAFLLGFAVTVAEPDLQVLAATVPHINGTVLLITVGVGVGFFLAVCMLRIVLGIRLRTLLLVLYAAVFILAAFTDLDFLSIAFDSGGVTTGPMTVPFILALGIGVSNIRSDEKAESDSFGLVALCSVGPIIAVMLLSMFYNSGGAETEITLARFTDSMHIGLTYLASIPAYLSETAISLLPIAVIFLAFNVFSLHLSKRSFMKISIGILYTYVGLVLFLTGVNIGFSPLGAVLGERLVSGKYAALAIPVSMLFGWFIISAEPAVAVLENQIEEVSAGAIPGKAIKLSLSAAVSIAMGIAMLRVLTGISVLWFLVPGYAIALLLSFFVPDIYTAIAFDSGGVASGPMTATFMLQFFIGASKAVGGNALSDAFGVVAMVAMVPLISIQSVGLVYKLRGKTDTEVTESAAQYCDYDIVELWED